MVLELIAALSSGFVAFAAALVLNMLSGRRLPRWAFPAAFGAGMIAFTIWAEYTWHSRATGAATPYVVIDRAEARVWYRPWTWVVPQTYRLTALDRRFTTIHPEQPGLIQTRVVRLARYVPESGFLAVIDCAGGQIAPLVEGVEMLADGTLEGADWAALRAEDPLIVGACALREEMSHDRGNSD